MIDWFSKLSIQKKVLSVSLAVAGLALVAAGIILMASEYEWARKKAVQGATSVSEMLAVYSMPPLIFKDHDTAQKVLASLKSEPKIETAVLYDSHSRFFAEYRRVGHAIAAPLEVPGKRTRSFRGGLLHTFTPIVMQGKKLGTLYLASDVSDISRQMEGFLLLLLVVAVFSAILAFLFSRYIQELVTRPVTELTGTVQSIAQEGNTSLRAKVRGQDEVGYLAVWVNSMMDRIQGQEEALKRDVRELQDKQGEINKLLVKISDDNVKLQKLDDLKSDFLSTVSHELRTPLTAISGFLRLLKGGKAGPLNEGQSEYTDISLRNIERLRRIVDQLLDLSRLEADAVDLDRQEMRIEEVLRSSCESLKVLIAEKGIQLAYRFEADIPTVMADPGRIAQVAVNLVENAVKFTPQGGKIEVGAGPVGTEEDPGVRFWVADSGVGIPPDKLEAVFDKFFQVEEPSTRKTGGSGLGLAIAKSIVEAHNGRIRAESLPGKGSTFHVTLPGLLKSTVAPKRPGKRDGPAKAQGSS